MVDTRRRSKRKPKTTASPETAVGPRTVYCLSEGETEEFARVMAHTLKGGELILLEGDLGLGKTVFARGLAHGLGVDPRDVSSPSFTLVQEYRGGRLPIFHLDLYRVELAEDMGTLGIEEILTAGGVVLVEWGDKLPPYLRRGATTIRLHDLGEGSRRLEVIPDPKAPVKRSGDA